MYAEVALFSVGIVGEAFTYKVPLSMAQECTVGSIVEVPFGKQVLHGLVVSCSINARTNEESAVKDIARIIAPSTLSETACQLMMRISSYYRAPLHKVVRLFMPEKIWTQRFRPQYTYDVASQVSADQIPRRMRKVHKILTDLQEGKDIMQLYTSREIQNLVDRQWITVKEKELISVYNEKHLPLQTPTLTKEQREVVEQIAHTIQGKYVLHGVTGAGKTRIYLELAKKMAALGKQTLILVPEIALTPQLLQYFSTEFHQKMSVLHSHLSEGERCQEWVRISSGTSHVIIGSRSALFAPIQRYGAIIMDEEHEWTYKNEQNPRYHARTVSNFLHELTGCLVVLGSATPSVETMYEAKKGHYTLLSLHKKIYEQQKD